MFHLAACQKNVNDMLFDISCFVCEVPIEICFSIYFGYVRSRIHSLFFIRYSANAAMVPRK